MKIENFQICSIIGKRLSFSDIFLANRIIYLYNEVNF